MGLMLIDEWLMPTRGSQPHRVNRLVCGEQYSGTTVMAVNFALSANEENNIFC